MELDAIRTIIRLQSEYPSLRCHIVHLSTSDALPLLRNARSNRPSTSAPLTIETCFHYLCLQSSLIPRGQPQFKCCPPIRDESNRELLWEGLKDGTIDFVVSDHSPCVASLKRYPEGDGDFLSAWGGISGLGLGLSLLWTEARKRGISIEKVVEWTSTKTAKHVGLDGVKGAIKEGLDADLVVWDPEELYLVCG
jgi:allantoinase